MSFVIAAFTFGLAAGLNPGPLGVFVIHQTMAKGYRSGVLASLIPFLTDLPIGLLVVLLTLQLRETPWFVVSISAIGSIYLARMAYKIFNSPNSIDLSKPEFNVDESVREEADTKPAPEPAGILDWKTGLKMNFLNPVPYIFWGTVGGVYIIKGTVLEACIFILCMLLTLSSTKFLVAVLIRFLGQRFSPRVYSGILRSLSLPMLIYSGRLMYSAITSI
jgi:threonine/homoserine/homoserine lactone efflux protein